MKTLICAANFRVCEKFNLFGACVLTTRAFHRVYTPETI